MVQAEESAACNPATVDIEMLGLMTIGPSESSESGRCAVGNSGLAGHLDIPPAPGYPLTWRKDNADVAIWHRIEDRVSDSLLLLAGFQPASASATGFPPAGGRNWQEAILFQPGF